MGCCTTRTGMPFWTAFADSHQRPRCVTTQGRSVTPFLTEVVEVVRQRVDWWSCNEREASLATGRAYPAEAAVELLARLPRGNVVVRLGMSGCLVAQRGSGIVHVPGVPVAVVDTTGAGDAHFGAYIAGLAAGCGAEARPGAPTSLRR